MMYEPLESRRHFAVSLAGNVLTITGTPRSDDIAIAAGKRTFVVHDNGIEHAFNVNKVKTIRINGGRGDDSIIISPKLGIRASIEAGPGNDRVGGGAGNDTIFGQAGNDTIAGNAGDDYLDAGTGDDRFGVGIGADVLHGGAGNDISDGVVYRLGSGVEEWGARLGNGNATSNTTDLRRVNDRLILVYEGSLGYQDVPPVQSGPTQRGTTYEITSSFRYALTGPVDDFKHTWDLTEIAGSGVVLTRYEAYAGSPLTLVFSVPLLLPRR